MQYVTILRQHSTKTSVTPNRTLFSLWLIFLRVEFRTPRPMSFASDLRLPLDWPLVLQWGPGFETWLGDCLPPSQIGQDHFLIISPDSEFSSPPRHKPWSTSPAPVHTASCSIDYRQSIGSETPCVMQSDCSSQYSHQRAAWICLRSLLCCSLVM